MSGATATLPSKRAKILVADDQRDTREALASVLIRKSYEVLLATDGTQALEYGAAEAPDLVITDVHMSGMDGIELIRRLKALKPNNRVLVMSSANDESLTRAREAGASATFVKPVAAAVLLEAIATLLEDEG